MPRKEYDRLRPHLVKVFVRLGTDEFPLTHEFLAQMLGVRPAHDSKCNRPSG